MLQELETAPLDTMSSVWPTTMEEIQTDKEVSLFERGFVVAIDAKLVTGNPFDAETLALGVDIYDPAEHYYAVRDKWGGLRTPDGR